jgi:hypothetical protein
MVRGTGRRRCAAAVAPLRRVHTLPASSSSSASSSYRPLPASLLRLPLRAADGLLLSLPLPSRPLLRIRPRSALRSP